MQAPDLLRAWREAKGLTQTAAAELIGVSQPSYSDYENGKKFPRIENAIKIAGTTDGAVPVAAWARTGGA